MTDWWLGRWSGAISLWLSLSIGGGIAALAWFGYRAADEWQRSSALLVERRTTEVATTVATALTRDMRAVQTSILDGREWSATFLASPYEMIDLVAGAFARYPYPEVFFGWQWEANDGVFFARSERLPPWLATTGRRGQYPVQVLRNPAVAARLLDRIRADVNAGRGYSIFETALDGATYQIVARPTLTTTARSAPSGGFAVLVNIDWARQHYFSALTSQVTRIAGAGEGSGLVATILDEHDQVIPGLAPAIGENPLARRPFPVMFFDPMLVALNPPRDLPPRLWTVQVSGVADPTLVLAGQGARRTLLVIAAGAVALAFGLFITTRAARAMSTVSEMRSDFVSTVTHELKTPVQVIRSIGETLARGRVSAGEQLHEYAQLLVQESHRLSRLIDNLLAYSRVTDVAQVYSFEALHPSDIISDALRGFHRLLKENDFRVRVDIPENVAAVRADRTAIVLALDNVIDNAMRYSGKAREIRVAADATGGGVEFSVYDNGVGIAPDELERVKRRFTRGRSAQGSGSGLGLAIVNRIVADHGGTLRIDSTPGVGTVVRFSLPQAEAVKEDAHTLTGRGGRSGDREAARR